MNVRFEKVTKQFGAHRALRGIDLDIASGECLVLLGPSGCGKTTLLRLLAGLETPDSGRIFVGDRDVSDVDPADRDVAMVFQNYALYPHMTVYENVAFPLRARKVQPGEIEARVKAAIARMELGEVTGRRPAQLSGGQQQRVALARAIVRSPAVYLMDEPLSNLDAQLRLHTRTELRRLQQELKTTTVYVTHDQSEAMTLGDRIALLRDGTIEQLGRPLDLYRRPATRFVARFLGSPPINLWRTRRQGSALEAAGLSFELPESGESAEIEIGVRPEDVVVSLNPRPGFSSGRVVLVEPMGNETLVSFEAMGERLVARAAASLEASAGSAIHYRVDPTAALCFDLASGRRMN